MIGIAALKESPARRIASNFLFYPAATIYAIFALPASVLAMLGVTAAIPGLAGPAQHGHEMLFGFALAVVMGNQGGAVSARRLILAFALWLTARITYLIAPQSLVSVLANAGFAAVVAWVLVPRLLRSVKKIRNLTLPVALGAICLSAIAAQVAPRIDPAASPRSAFEIAILLFALLMLFMGGRIIVPAVAGQFYKQGQVMQTRVQPRIESASAICVALAIPLLLLGGIPFATRAAAVSMITAGILCAVRLARWRVWALRGRPDLVCLAIGYAWLAIGLVLLGAAALGAISTTAAMHAITVGSLGTLTLNVMAMSWMFKAHLDPSRAGPQVCGTVLLGAAAIARILAGQGVGDPRSLLLFAAAGWSLAFALLLIVYLRARIALRGQPARQRVA